MKIYIAKKMFRSPAWYGSDTLENCVKIQLDFEGSLREDYG